MAEYFNRTLTLWYVLGLCVIKCHLCCIYQNLAVVAEEVVTLPMSKLVLHILIALNSTEAFKCSNRCM